MLTWQESYATGVPAIDVQHEMFFSVINDLGRLVEQRGDETTLKNALNFLGSYAKIHFNFEEICMTQHQCPVAGKNCRAHQKFMEDYQGYKERFEKEGYSEKLLVAVHKMAEDWLVSHICNVDIHLKECVRRQAE